ncbi:MAG TPA: MFS transporter [Acidimicrobiales bacterium]|nr:MFS transporter [Acidimicrobiales bacterium]
MSEGTRRFKIDGMLGGASLVPLAVLFGLNAVDELDRAVFAVLIPEIKDHFDVGLGAVTTVIAIAGFVALAGQVLVGFYGDRLSRVRFSVIGASVWAVFTLLTGLAPGLVVLAIARAGSGLGKAVNDPMHSSLLSDYYDPNTRVKAFYWYRIANNVGVIAGPVIGGLLAYSFGWRTPFIVFTIPTIIFVVLAMRLLREPVRGRWEREAAGGDDEAALLEDDPPSFAESWKVAHSVKSLKRIFISLPWFAAALFGIATLFSVFYDEIYSLNEAQRGFLAAAVEPAQIVGSLYGIRLVTRSFLKDPGLILKLVAAGGLGVAGGLVIMAVSPNLAVAVVGHALVAGSFGPLTAGIYSTMSVVAPPRIRTMVFGIGALWFMPGLVLLGAVGGISDAIGIRGGIALMAPVLAVGAFLMASGGAFVRDDIRRVQTAALAQAEIRRSRLEGDPKLLVCRGLDVAYGQTQVLFNVDFHVDDGEIVALLGTNGAGKSTLLSAISGLVEPSGGAIVFDGKDITVKPANETVAAGIVMVPGGKGVFPTLTVQENLELAGWLFNKDKEHIEEATAKVLEYFPILRERWNEKAGNMSGGEQQMLTLGQAFIARPKLLMIDELSLGLAPVIVEQLLEIVKAIHAQGTTIILVEQSVNVAITVAKRAVFMEKGEVRFDGPTAGLLDQPEILRAVFLQGAAAGQDAAKGKAKGKAAAAAKAAESSVVGSRRFVRGEPQTILETTGLSVAFGGIRAVNDVSIQLAEGEILGLIGPNGAGKTTIMDLVSGFLTPSTGRVRFEGEDITELSPDLRAMRGLGRSFQDARLFPALTVTENLAIAFERHIKTRDPIAAALMSPATRVSEKEVAAKVDDLIHLMNLGAFANKFVGELSTGTRRVVDIACSLAHGPSVLLLDEPSSGIAQRETEALGPVLMNIREQTGAALLVIEHDMPLIQSISDRLVALELGAVIAEGSPTDVINHPRVVESYLGESAAVINRSGDSIDLTSTKKPATPRRRKQLVASAGRGGESK